MSAEDDEANLVLADIERSEEEILAVYREPVSTRGAVGYQHLYLFGVARRALSQSIAFRQMIAARNSVVALSLIRLQLDTVLRLYALFWVDDAEHFAKEVFSGVAIDKLKAADGSLMKDKYLRDKLSARNDWMSSVYTETSGYIHFSHRHIKAAFATQDSARAMAQVQIAPYDTGKTISYYGEILRAFRHINMMIPVAAADWFSRLQTNGTSAGFGEIGSG
jgi:hypothetical protein